MQTRSLHDAARKSRPRCIYNDEQWWYRGLDIYTSGLSMAGYDFLQRSSSAPRSLPLAAIAPLPLHARIQQHVEARCSAFAAGALGAGRPSRSVYALGVADIAVADAHGRNMLVTVADGRPRPRAVSEHRLRRGEGEVPAAGLLRGELGGDGGRRHVSAGGRDGSARGRRAA